jgi:hypothetical protein
MGQDRTMADTNGISIAETDAGNARMMIASAGCGGDHSCAASSVI